MTSNALEEKINKIRQQNEEIRRRHQEVEEDKKTAAKFNALVQMVPSSDWPERKEPPEFSNPPKAKPKLAKEKHEYTMQAHPVEGKKIHSFAHGEGPPPDPKYNFLADSEREEPGTEYGKEPSGNKSHNKVMRGNFKTKRGGRENHMQKDNKMYKGSYRDDSQPGYDAWRAERNRIDEDRISRQRTAEGNWRREWDNDKMHIIDDVAKKATRSTLGDFAKKDHKDSDRRYHSNNNEYISHTRGGNRRHRGTSKNFYGNYENRSHNAYDQHRNNTTMPPKPPLSPTSEERTVIATDSSIKVTVNQGNTPKGPVMSVKVNSPSIAGTGRVGPRQRTRVTYSHSDAEVPVPESESFHRQKSFEDKSKGTYFNNPKSPNVKRSHSQKTKEGEAKYPYQRKEIWREKGDANSPRYHENEFRTYTPRNIQKSQPIKSPKAVRRDIKSVSQNLQADSPSNLSDELEPLNGESNIKNEDSNIVSETEVEQVSASLSEGAEAGAEYPKEVTKDVEDVFYPVENECPETVDQQGTYIAMPENSMSSNGMVSSIVEPVAKQDEANMVPVKNEEEANVEPVKNEEETNVEPVKNESQAKVEPVKNELEANVDPVKNESEPITVEPAKNELEPNVESLADSMPKMDAVSVESIIKSASIESASFELASFELASVESASIELASVESPSIEIIPSDPVPNMELVSVSSSPKVESVPVKLVPAQLKEEPVEMVPEVEPVSAESVTKIELVSTESVGKTESVSVESVPKVEPVPAQSIPKVESVPVKSIPTVESVPVELVPNVEAIPAELAAKEESISTVSAAKMESIPTELAAKDQSILIESVPKVEPLSIESVPKVEPVVVDSIFKEEPVPAESESKVETVPAESESKVETVPAESTSEVAPVPAESTSEVAPVPAESTSEVEPVPAESVSKVELISGESVPKTEPVLTESTPKVDPAPVESAAEELVPKIAPVPIESATKPGSVPAESVPKSEPIPAESVPNESNNASKPSGTVAASSKEDRQVQISGEVVKDDCDTVEDEIAEQRRTSPTKNEPASSSSEAAANSVIHVENQLVCGNESVAEQTLLADAEVVKRTSDEESHGTENTQSMVENTEKIEAMEEDARVEL